MRTRADTRPVLVDCAGARMGGALRFRDELDAYLARRSTGSTGSVRVIGRDRRLGPGWLARRESPRPYRRLVALNNVSFVATRGERWVLLRNILHFLSTEEARALPGGRPADVSRTGRIVRAFARGADVVVVPTSTMAQRVLAALPDLSSRVIVRAHPLSRPAVSANRNPSVVLCPVLFAPFKPMGRVLRLVDAAAGQVAREGGRPVSVVVTATEREAREHGLLSCRRLRFVGRLSPAQLVPHQQAAGVMLQPTTLESFGYPLAEARLAGVPVVARDTPHNREVAGPMLVPCPEESPDGFAAALRAALTFAPPVEKDNPFDPTRYFDWLLDAPEGSA